MKHDSDRELVATLAALAQATRLAILRLVSRAGAEGIAAGEIARSTDPPPATVSFHLKEITQAGLLKADLDPLEFALTLAGCSYGLVDMASQCGEMLPVAPEVFVARGWALLLGAVSAPGVEPGRFLVQPAVGN